MNYLASLENLEKMTSDKNSIYYHTDEAIADLLNEVLTQLDNHEKYQRHGGNSSRVIQIDNEDEGGDEEIIILDEDSRDTPTPPSTFNPTISSYNTIIKFVPSSNLLSSTNNPYEKHRDTPFQCTDCGDILPNLTKVQHHIQFDVRCKTCSLCRMECPNNENLRSHILNHHKLVKKYCGFCSKSYSIENLRHHYFVKHRLLIRQAYCKLCPPTRNGKHMYNFPDYYHLIKHFVTYHTDYTYCFACDKKLDDMNERMDHYFIEHGIFNLNQDK